MNFIITIILFREIGIGNQNGSTILLDDHRSSDLLEQKMWKYAHICDFFSRVP